MNYWKYNHPAKNVFSWLLMMLVVAGAILLLNYSKDSLFWALNQQHTYPGDLFFSYFTHVGDGLMMIGLGVVLMGLGKRRLGLLLIISFLFSGLIVQICKKGKPEPRPGRYFTEVSRIHKVRDQPLTGNNSFPSGHTTTAFAMFAMLALFTGSHILQLCYFLMALLVAYSRIYLGQHFFKDVYAGAILGYLCTLLIVWIFRNKELGGRLSN